MGDSVRWYILKSNKYPNKWMIRNVEVLTTFADSYHINSKIQVKIVKPFDSFINSSSFYFPTRKAARAALRCYRIKWFGMYAKYWNKQIKRSLM